MPTYTYECKKCEHAFEMFHAITADPVVKCPECGGRCRRLLGTGAGIIFKGSGFYETDYKRSGKTASKTGGSNGSSNSSDSAKKSSEAGTSSTSSKKSTD